MVDRTFRFILKYPFLTLFQPKNNKTQSPNKSWHGTRLFYRLSLVFWNEFVKKHKKLALASLLLVCKANVVASHGFKTKQNETRRANWRQKSYAIVKEDAMTSRHKISAHTFGSVDFGGEKACCVSCNEMKSPAKELTKAQIRSFRYKKSNYATQKHLLFTHILMHAVLSEYNLTLRAYPTSYLPNQSKSDTYQHYFFFLENWEKVRAMRKNYSKAVTLPWFVWKQDWNFTTILINRIFVSLGTQGSTWKRISWTFYLTFLQEVEGTRQNFLRQKSFT